MIEWRAIDFGQAGDQIERERHQADDRNGNRDRADEDDRLEDEPIPHRATLGLDDPLDRHRPGQQHRDDDHDGRRYFVAHVLHDRAHPAKERILVHRRPAGEHDAERGQGAECQQIQDADVDVGHLQAWTEGDDGPGHERRAEHDHRRQKMQCAVDLGRGDDLFGQQLEDISRALEQAERPHPVRPPAVLQPSDEASFGP